MNNLNSTLILLSTSLLFACGGGGSSKATNPTPNGGGTSTTLKEVLPFDLQSNDGSVALSISTLGSLSSPVPHLRLFDLHVDDTTYLWSYAPRKCVKGNMDYQTNLPTGQYLSDKLPSDPNPLEEVLIAQQCKIGYFDYDGYLKLITQKNEATEEERKTYTFKDFALGYNDGFYQRYVNSEGELSDQQKHKIQIFLTADFEQNSAGKGDNTFYTTKSKKHEYTYLTDYKLTVENILLEKRGNSVLHADFHAYWEVNGGREEEELYSFDLADTFTGNIVGLGKETTLALGKYNLSVKVTSPLTIPNKPKNALLFSAGSVRVELLSHDITADITYHPGYADVVYMRGSQLINATYKPSL